MLITDSTPGVETKIRRFDELALRIEEAGVPQSSIHRLYELTSEIPIIEEFKHVKSIQPDLFFLAYSGQFSR